MKNEVIAAKNILLNRNKPISLIHFITNKCNARCPHCFIDFENKEQQRMKLSLEDIDRLTKNIGPELLNVNITGGEPFYSNDLKEICDLYIKNTSIKSIFFSTHGGAQKKIKEFAEYIVRYPKHVFIFSISIDHIGDKHSDYRGVKNLYEQAIETYLFLKNKAKNIKVHVTITVSEFNALDINDIFHELRRLGVDEITANIVRDEGVYRIDEKSKKQILAGYRTLIENIEQLNESNKKSSQSLITKLYSSLMSHKDELMHKYIADIYLEPRYVLPCYAGGGLMGVIYPNGDVYPCEILDKKMGNLYDEDFDIQKIWKNNQKLRDWIITNKCNCTYECAWSFNLLASPKERTGFVKKAVKQLFN